MFVVGKKYDIEISDGVDHDGKPCINTYPGRTVVDTQPPLIKVNWHGEEKIINTSSHVFVQAIPSK